MRRCPTFLALPSGEVIGPFHAGCAERKVLDARRHRGVIEVSEALSFGNVNPAREETLPW